MFWERPPALWICLQKKEKTYETVLRLGIETDTQDMTGQVLKELPVQISEEKLKETVEVF